MTLPDQRFSKILESLDGDIELFAGIAGPVARHYAAYAEQMQTLLNEADYVGLEKMAHKLKATWALYSIEDPDAPERLEVAIRTNNIGSIVAMSEFIIGALCVISGELNTWVKNYRGNNN